MNSIRVSIVTYNNEETIKRCLDSVYDQKGDFELVVSVVDNDSSDGTVKEIIASYPNVELIEAGKNLGFGAGHNRILRECKEAFCLVLNPDAWLMESALAQLKDVLDGHDEIALVGPRMEYEDARPQLSFGSFPGLITDLKQRYYTQDVQNSKHVALKNLEKTLEAPFQPDWVSGSCFLARTKVLQDIGCFDENYFLYFEDVDLCRRLQINGLKVQIEPKAVCRHLEGHSDIPHASRKLHYRRSRLIYENKFGSRLGFILYKLLRTKGIEYNWDSALRQKKSK